MASMKHKLADLSPILSGHTIPTLTKSKLIGSALRGRIPMEAHGERVAEQAGSATSPVVPALCVNKGSVYPRLLVWHLS